MKRKFFTTALKVIAVTTIVVGIINVQSVTSKATYHDSAFRYTINSDEYETTDVYTGSRSKDDYSSAYVYNRYSQSEISYIRVMGATNDATEGPLYNMTYGTAKSCPVGEYRYLPNLVKENGYNYAGLMFDPGNGYHNYISILWSPDSI